MKIILSILLMTFTAAGEEQLELFPNDANSVQLISQLAEDIGEYFSEDAISDAGYTYKEMNSENDDVGLTLLASSLIDKREKWLAQPTAAVFGKIYAVYKNNTLIGYIIALEDSLENEPLWDGSGITHYISTQLAVVESIEWAG